MSYLPIVICISLLLHVALLYSHSCFYSLISSLITVSFHSPFLRYGVGYHMVVVKKPQCDSLKVTDIVMSIVEGAEQVTDVGAELSFILPSTSTGSFPALFDALEGEHKVVLCYLYVAGKYYYAYSAIYLQG